MNSPNFYNYEDEEGKVYPVKGHSCHGLESHLKAAYIGLCSKIY